MLSEITAWSEQSPEAQAALLRRPALADHDSIREEAAGIIAAVREFGDNALFDFAMQFDGCSLDSLKVSGDEFASAESTLAPEAKAAIDVAIANVRRFHEAQLPVEIDVAIGQGIRCERYNRPIDSVGLYVPAGSAPLPSTAIMLAVPAAIAACPVRVMCTPPDKDGNVNAATLVAAKQSGITE
ncbi:MAG: histidinol dehydrogenase, partial [Gammaproteobacteria bacterium]|nr:histidinol dehydrogenase [Gammaproteobacteria bacterium]